MSRREETPASVGVVSLVTSSPASVSVSTSCDVYSNDMNYPSQGVTLWVRVPRGRVLEMQWPLVTNHPAKSRARQSGRGAHLGASRRQTKPIDHQGVSSRPEVGYLFEIDRISEKLVVPV